MSISFLFTFFASLIPLAIGFIWYNPKVFGKAWMESAGLSEESMKGWNIIRIFAITYFFSFLIALEMNFMVVHQFHVFSLLANEPGVKDPNSEVGQLIKIIMDKYGNNFRTFKHGALHGAIAGVFLALPIMGINALFDRRGFKYIAINAGFWILCFTLMGGLICAFP